MTPVIAKQSVNGTKPAPKRPRGRDMAADHCRLRVFLYLELRRQFEAAGVQDAEQWGPGAVTSAAINMEHRGIYGIPADSDVDVVQ